MLQETDPPVYDFVAGDRYARALITVDHAGVAVPQKLKGMGVEASDLKRHISYDIGIRGVVEAMSQQLQWPTIFSNYSRLVVDLNRNSQGDESLIPPISDGTEVPANMGLTEQDRQNRLQALYWPYHNRIESEVDALFSSHENVAIVCMHSMTPELRGTKRPWDVSVLWEWDDRLARPLLNLLRQEKDLVIGENVPYSGRQKEGVTTRWHGARRDLPHVIIELRQDLIESEKQQAAWGKRLAPILEKALDEAMKIDPKLETELQAAAFRRLVAHLRERNDVQNIDMMNLAGFCRNCLSKWTAAEAEERGLAMNYDEAREYIYGMPYADWKEQFQSDASPAQKQAFEENKHA